MKKREKTLKVRCSDDEWEVLQVLSNSAGMSMSELVRDHLGKVKVRNRQDEKERTVMLNRINANLNMIARWANTHKSAGESIQVISQLMVIKQEIKEFLSDRRV